MRLHIFTLFPEMFQGPFSASIIKRAQEKGVVSIDLVNIRDFATDRHKTVDDYPFGGGPGMVMKPEPIFAAVERTLASLRENSKHLRQKTVLLTPQGKRLDQKVAQDMASLTDLLLICGHYEGVDERVRKHLVEEEISIGDYVLSGGELASMVVADAVIRLIPGVLGDQASAQDDSYADGLLQFPQYTRPQEFRGWQVPEVLMSGHHAEVARWRRQQSLLRTMQRRPDLLGSAAITPEERKWLEEMIDVEGIGRR